MLRSSTPSGYAARQRFDLARVTRPLSIVITGAPGSGKTTLTRAIVERLPDRLALVPEAATQYYRRLGKRWDQLDLDNRRVAQRGIYQLQVEQESRIAREHAGKALLLDRGTIDGSAYWPDGPDAYWCDLGVSRDDELARYDRVIVLQTAAHLGIYDGDASNNVRFEDSAGAIANEKLLTSLWSDHADLVIIPAMINLHDKLDAALSAVETALDRASR